MPLAHSLITLSNTSTTTLTVDGDTVPSNMMFSVQNVHDSASVYIGNSSVSSSSYGVLLEPGAFFSVENLRKDTELYAISTVANSKVAVMRFTFS
jgi:hypothetical protein